MAREIKGTSTASGNFPPSVRLETKGSSIKGLVTDKRTLPVDAYNHTNVVVTLKLIDLQGDASTSISVAKGEYQEVDVNVGDLVDFVGRGTDLRQKIPLLNVGDTVTITNMGETPKKKGRNPKKLFRVEVDE